ncbi:MAG: hypothetical protein IKU37_07975 [Candidatus Gastranaerophilales bacterium]|nr:hypothetical protein [Candidatus Gastranaerophilales bacterium]
MSVNFCGKLIIDKSLYSLRQSKPDEIIALTKRFLDSPKIQQIVPEDIILSGKGLKGGDVVEIRYGDKSFDISSKGSINSATVPQQILIAICEKYGKRLRGTSFSDIMAKIAEIIKENSAN